MSFGIFGIFQGSGIRAGCCQYANAARTASETHERYYRSEDETGGILAFSYCCAIMMSLLGF